jgi:hypothetical protein
MEALMTASACAGAFPDQPGASVTWQRSARCDVNGSCVEVALLPTGKIGVRDGKIGAASPVLSFSPQSWRGFVSGVRAGQAGAS